jgi:hypothetical protein
MVVCYVDSDDAGAVGGLVFGGENGNLKSGVHYYRNFSLTKVPLLLISVD